jgi:hypothetical protein
MYSLRTGRFQVHILPAYRRDDIHWRSSKHHNQHPHRLAAQEDRALTCKRIVGLLVFGSLPTVAGVVERHECILPVLKLAPVRASIADSGSRYRPIAEWLFHLWSLDLRQ